MSNEPILLFLHGVGDGDQDDNWKIRLSESLVRLGYPDLATANVIAPKYAHALKGWDEKVPLPSVTIKEPSREAAKTNRREFERRIGALEFRLGRHDRGEGRLGGDALVDVAIRMGGVGLPLMAQAHKYLHDPQIRAQVLTSILAKLPVSGSIIVVGHSLGSVIAADLVRRLPSALKVIGMVTIGSPLANGRFEVDKLREALKEPPTNLAWWVNFWNASDPVAAHRGVSSVFPWMIDFRIDTKTIPPFAHYAVNYFANEAVVAAIGFALFGSQSKELAEVNADVDIPLDYSERMALLALRYVHLVKDKVKDTDRDRFNGAARQVQAVAVDEMKKRIELEERPLPSEVAGLAFDPSDPQAVVPEPQPSRFLSKEQAVVPLTVLAAENVIRPFEIDISKEAWQAAMRDLTAEMGLGSQYGTDVFAAAKKAQDALSDRGMNWVKWGALGVGAAAIVIATGGLALAAAPGLVGAAVITSALASFGPGGMIGGLLMAGSLVTAGGGGIAFGLASPGTTAEALEAIVERRLAAEILRQSQNLESDPAVWATLVETEIEIRRQYERLDEFSDEKSPSLNELKRKIVTIERALKYLRDNGLEPLGENQDASGS